VNFARLGEINSPVKAIELTLLGRGGLLQRKGLRGRKASPAGMDSPVFKYSFVKISLGNAKDAPPQLD